MNTNYNLNTIDKLIACSRKDAERNAAQARLRRQAGQGPQSPSLTKLADLLIQAGEQLCSAAGMDLGANPQ
jgi:hypothetical protein